MTETTRKQIDDRSKINRFITWDKFVCVIVAQAFKGNNVHNLLPQ